MRVRVNGETVEVEDEATVRRLLEHVALHEAACAVAVNRAFVPRGEHARHRLRPDDEVEIVAPMQGG